ncbi:MAG: hypothetical protein HRT57_03970 [Crocinitomicaceae bacterium]|nr:hypothetical protein [Crocinitomicaceae bacterium]
MRKALLSLAFGLLLVSSANAQDITINEYGETVNVSGQTIDISVSEADTVYLTFNNLSQSSKLWHITGQVNF